MQWADCATVFVITNRRVTINMVNRLAYMATAVVFMSRIEAFQLCNRFKYMTLWATARKRSKPRSFEKRNIAM
jgi:hypothetical protein